MIKKRKNFHFLLKKLVGLILLFCLTSSVFAQFKSKQMLVVTSLGWDSIHGKLNFYQWNDSKNKWENKIADIPVVLGKKGMAWGNGLQNPKFNTGILKKEGDKRAPAGIFYLRQAFSYYNAPQIVSMLDLVKTDSTVFCVDDLNSIYYNQLVDIDTVPKKDWKSAERMFFNDVDYKYGIFVGYNTDPVEKGKGSCIFVHLTGIPISPTAGCTAMQEEIIVKLLKLLDKSKNPVLIQVPEKEYLILKKEYKLP